MRSFAPALAFLVFSCKTGQQVGETKDVIIDEPMIVELGSEFAGFMVDAGLKPDQYCVTEEISSAGPTNLLWHGGPCANIKDAGWDLVLGLDRNNGNILGAEDNVVGQYSASTSSIVDLCTRAFFDDCQLTFDKNGRLTNLVKSTKGGIAVSRKQRPLLAYKGKAAVGDHSNFKAALKRRNNTYVEVCAQQVYSEAFDGYGLLVSYGACPVGPNLPEAALRGPVFEVREEKLQIQGKTVGELHSAVSEGSHVILELCTNAEKYATICRLSVGKEMFIQVY